MRGLATKLQCLCWSSTNKILHFRLSSFATLAKPKKAHLNQEEASSFGSLFSEITEILGAENVAGDRTPTGFIVSKGTLVGIGEVLEERTHCMPSDFRDAKVDEVEEKEGIAVVEETSLAETHVSPVVHEVTKIVRGECGLVSMEEKLEKLGLKLDAEVVDKVLKRCFKVPHLALRFFNWVKLKEGFCHTTKTYNTVLCIAGEAKEFGVVEKLVEEMEGNSCEKDVRTWTILIQVALPLRRSLPTASILFSSDGSRLSMLASALRLRSRFLLPNGI